MTALTLDDFARLCGSAELPPAAIAIARARDFRYRVLRGAERDAVLLGVIRRIVDGRMWVSGPDKLHIWESGWGENLEEYRRTRDVAALMPKFLKAQPLRLFGDYVLPESPTFEFDVVDVFRHWLFTTYLESCDSLYEFGCGSCQHLPVLASLRPGRPVCGLDWSQASQDIIAELAADIPGISGRRFDMFHPPDLPLDPGAGVLTVGALEQLGTSFGPFLGYLLAQKPRMVVNVETMAELYEDSVLLDYLATAYDARRNYLRGWLTRLRDLETEGKVRIHRTWKTPIGGLYHDSYCFVAWSPTE